jgi:rare lipoprotein A
MTFCPCRGYRLSSLLLPLLITTLLLAGCAPKIISTPAKRQVTQQPAKQPPASTVPATQRPYVINGKTYYPLPSAEGYTETGLASWYGHPFHGRRTSNGETYDMHDWTAAHKTLPMNTRLLVENLENGRQTTVRINDRGPFVKGRIIDLSRTVAQHLDVLKEGTARVRITALGEAVTVRLDRDRTATRFLPHEDFQKGEFYVQVGSFTNKDNAERLKNQFLNWGRKAVIQPHDRGDGIFYRVQVRAGNALSVANHMERVLNESGFPDAFVVAR